MAGIYYPTLDLFYYYATSGFGVTETEVKHLNTYWATLQSKNDSDENPIRFHEKGEFQGRFLRQNLKDSNCFHFDCSIDEKLTPHTPDVIPKLKAKIEPLPPESILCFGFTWMIYGWVNNNDNDQNNNDQTELARESYKQLVEKEWQHYREGKLLGAKVIEAWRSPNEWDVPEASSHVFIMLYPDQITYNEASKKLITDDWRRILLCRHKISHAYQKSRDYKVTISKSFNDALPALQKHISLDSKQNNSYKLDDMRKDLERNRIILSTYSVGLHLIRIHKESLDTNLDTYNLLVKQFIAKANGVSTSNNFGDNDLKFLEDFGTIAEIKYERQLEKDYATLAPGLAVLAGLTETIRGLVEVQQAEIDRQQTTTIAIVGLGLAASSAVAGIVATQVYQPDNTPTSTPSPSPPTSWSLSNNIFTNGSTLLKPSNQRIHWSNGLEYSLVPAAITLLVLVGVWAVKNIRKI